MKPDRFSSLGCLLTAIFIIGTAGGLLTALILEIKGKTDSSEVAAGIGVLCLTLLAIDIFVFKCDN